MLVELDTRGLIDMSVTIVRSWSYIVISPLTTPFGVNLNFLYCFF